MKHVINTLKKSATSAVNIAFVARYNEV